MALVEIVWATDPDTPPPTTVLEAGTEGRAVVAASWAEVPGTSGMMDIVKINYLKI